MDSQLLRKWNNIFNCRIMLGRGTFYLCIYNSQFGNEIGNQPVLSFMDSWKSTDGLRIKTSTVNMDFFMLIIIYLFYSSYILSLENFYGFVFKHWRFQALEILLQTLEWPLFRNSIFINQSFLLNTKPRF